MSDPRRRRLKDILLQTRTDLDLAREKPWPIVVVAIAATGLAVVLAPEARTRSEADSLWPVFLGLLAVTVAILAAYPAIARKRQTRARRYGLAIVAVGCIAAILGLLRLPLGLFRFVFAVAVGALVHGVLVVVVLLF